VPDRQDLGAVAPVGVPSAGGVSLDPKALVDLGVVACPRNHRPSGFRAGESVELLLVEAFAGRTQV
jgi:hypothetical protein